MNGLTKAIGILDKVGIFSRWTNVVGVVFLFFMVVVTFIDVIMRYIFNNPIVGVYEITEVMMICAIFLAVAHTQNMKSHISIDLVTSKLAPKPRLALEFITTLLGLGTFIVVTWRIIAQTMFFISKNTMHSQFLPIPSAPFASVIALGCIALTLLLLRDVLRLAVEALELELGWKYWLSMFGVPVLFIALAIFWMQPDLWQTNLPTVGLIGVIISLVLFMSGMPISFSLILTSLIFTAHIRGAETSLVTLGTELYRNAGTYSWSVLPFFVLMGFFCFHAKFGEDLYLAAYKWFGHMRGGMAIATVGACTGFAAIVGDSVAATATMGAVALPEMKKFKYDTRLSAGSIVSGATLGPIIPPSVLFIIFGVLTAVPIGDLFVAGIIPGLLIAAIFCLIIIAWCRINPTLGPSGERSAWIPRLVSLRAGGPVAVLFLLVIGGIYLGVFTPTEGGAIGGLGAFIIALIMRRWTWRNFSQAMLDSGKTVSMVFLILVSALMFTRFAGWCNLSGTVTDLITGLGLSPAGFMLLTLFIVLVFGCFIDIMALILIGVPILYPVATALGINPLWFGLLICLAMNTGALTPPVGINLFVLKGLNKEIPMGAIYRGTLPFVLGTTVAIVILFIYPSLVTWLPGVLK